MLLQGLPQKVDRRGPLPHVLKRTQNVNRIILFSVVIRVGVALQNRAPNAAGSLANQYSIQAFLLHWANPSLVPNLDSDLMSKLKRT